MSGKAFLGKLHFDLEESLVEGLSTARRDDPYSPVTVLVGSNILGVYLRRTLADRLGGLFNVRFMTLADLAAAIAQAGAGGPRRALPPFADRVILADILGREDLSRGFGEVSRTAGFVEALLATFADLSEAGCRGEEARALAKVEAPGAVEVRAGQTGAARGSDPTARLAERTRAVLSLFARFRDRVEELGGDLHSTFAGALEAPLPASIGRLFLAYGFYDFNEVQWRLVSRIAAEREMTLFVPWGSGRAHRFTKDMKEKVAARGFEAVELGRVEASARPWKPVLLNLPGEEEEVREIARRLLVLAGERGCRFGEMAIILPSVEAYAPLCREILSEAGIPYYMSARVAGATGAGAGASTIIKVLGGAMERRDVVEFLASAPLRDEAGRVHPCDRAALWIRKSAEAGMIGERGWVEESAGLVESLRSSVGKRAGGAEALEAARGVEALMQRIAEARESLRGASSWSALAERVSTLTGELFRESDETEAARRAIDDLAGLDAVAAPAALESFLDLAESALAARSVPIGRFGDEGVNVLSLEQARGLSFKAVFIPGLAERIFPSMARQDPLMSDRERRAINDISGGKVRLAYKFGRLDEEALLFELARGSAREALTCSHPRFEEGTGKERIPSSFLGLLPGYSIDGAPGPELQSEWVARGGSAVPDAALVSVHELDLRRAVAYRGGKGSLPDNACFQRGAKLVRRRWGARIFTEYDGVFSSKRAIGALGEMLEERGWRFAPTALERYAGCPFDYFCTDVLSIDVVEEPERILTITPAQRGHIYHQVLARVFGELKAQGLLPLRTAPAEKALGVAEAVTAGYLEEVAKTEPVGLPVFWEMEKRLAQESIRLLLEEERTDEGDFVPAYFERSFGRDRDRTEVPYECGARSLRFCGWIDRVDLGGGERFRVIDYKTGALRGEEQDLAGGTALQLPVYLMASAAMLGRPMEAGEAYYRQVRAGSKRDVVRFSGARWHESAPQFAKIIATITNGIERGIFLAPADDQGCKNCTVKAACPAGMSRLFARKAAEDPRAREYLEMTQPEASDEES